MELLAVRILLNLTMTISSPNIVDKYLNHGASLPTPTHSLSHSDQIGEIHGMDFWQSGQPQMNLQHILNSLVVIVVTFHLYLVMVHLILASVYRMWIPSLGVHMEGHCHHPQMKELTYFLISRSPALIVIHHVLVHLLRW